MKILDGVVLAILVPACDPAVTPIASELPANRAPTSVFSVIFDGASLVVDAPVVEDVGAFWSCSPCAWLTMNIDDITDTKIAVGIVSTVSACCR